MYKYRPVKGMRLFCKLTEAIEAMPFIAWIWVSIENFTTLPVPNRFHRWDVSLQKADGQQSGFIQFRKHNGVPSALIR